MEYHHNQNNHNSANEDSQITIERNLDSKHHHAGLNEVDFMTRQRYLGNSSFNNFSVHIASHPALPHLMSSNEVHKYVQEQRDIINTFRSQPWPMQTKIAALTAYKDNVAKYACQMNTIHTFQDNVWKVKGRFLRFLSTVASTLTIWNSIIKQIEGRFGSSVASFFTFLRWLCGINLLMMTMILAFLVIPQIISGNGLEVPQSVRQNGSALSFIVDGKGYLLEYSVLFHGYYDSGRNEPYYAPPHNPNPEIGTGYKLPLAYLSVIIAIFIVCKIAILIKMSKKYKFLQKSSLSEQYLFAWKVFASWDHTITNAETAEFKRQHLSISLKETIIEAEAMVKQIQWRYLAIRIVVQICVCITLIGSAYAIYLAVENTDYTINPVSFSDALLDGFQGIWLFLRSFQVQAVIVARGFVLPYIFQFAQYLEHHHPRTALKLMLVRLFVLYMSSMYVLIIAFFTFNRQCASLESSNSNNNSTSVTASNQTSFNNNTTTATTGNVFCCWETSIGQELYKLSITNLLAELCTILCTDVFRWAIVHWNLCPRLTNLIGLAEFDLAENILRLVYGQALVWFGVLFCPFLPGLNFFRIVVLFYIRSFVVSMFNKPPQTLFRVASTKTFYMGLLLINGFLCIFPVSYAIIQITPSEVCGPFRGLSSMAGVITNEIATWPNILQVIISYIITPTVIIPFIGLQFIIIYYFASLTSALKEINKDVRLQLHLEQKVTLDRLRKHVNDTTANLEKSSSCRSPSCVLRYNYLQQQIHLELNERFNHNNNNNDNNKFISTSTCEEIIPESLSPLRPPRARGQRIRVVEVPDDDDDDELYDYHQSRRHSSLPSRPTYADLHVHDPNISQDLLSDTTDPELGTTRHSSM